MSGNPTSSFYKWLKFCIRVITRFNRCSKIIYHVKKNVSVSWKWSLGNIMWNQGSKCDGMVHLQGAIVGHPSTAILIRQDYNTF